MTSGPDLQPRSRLLSGLGLGALAGALSGLFGIGGGAIIVWGLAMWLSLPQHVAHATSLAAILLIAPAALVGFALDGSVAYAEAGILAVGGIFGAFGGAGVMHRISPRRLTQAFAVLLLLIAAGMAIPAELGGGASPGELDALRLAALVGVGLGVGMLSSIMGVGGAIVLVPMLVLLFDFSQHLAEGTSLLVVIPTALVGAIRHASHGYTDWRLGLLVGAGGIIAGAFGAQLALALPAAWLQALFALLLAFMAVRLLLRTRDSTGDRAASGSLSPAGGHPRAGR